MYDNNYDKDTFFSMIHDWQADGAPEYDDLIVNEPEQDDTGAWSAIAHDDKATYSLTDDGSGNIRINYEGTRS